MSLLALVKTPRQVAPASEAEVLLRAKEGDGEAFRRLLAIYKDRVYGYLRRCGFDRATCEDLAQETFLKVHVGLPSYEPSRPLAAWILTIAANTVRSHLRRRAVRQPLLPMANEPAGHEPDPLDASVGLETASRLEQALRRLPMPQRQVVILCCIEMLSQEVVSEALDMPVNTVKTNLRRARLALLSHLERREP